jgi:hypothetical protein
MIARSKLGPIQIALLLFAAPGCSDRTWRTPTEIEPAGWKLPRGTSNFFEHHSGGVPFSMFQYRFDLPSKELPSLAAQLPCTLGVPKTGPPDFANVGTNDRTWYSPDQATSHRGCDGRVGNWDFDVLLDVSKPDVITTFIVLSD